MTSTDMSTPTNKEKLNLAFDLMESYGIPDEVKIIICQLIIDTACEILGDKLKTMKEEQTT